ncbi:MAG: hypothetical protein EXQ74_02730 [Thermoleophilia bacterium]|nr:hypothetical protein [Thermoleophilia bacterium]
MTPDPNRTIIVMDSAIAEVAGVARHPAVRPVVRASVGRRCTRATQTDGVLDVLAAADGRAIVLARPPWADPPLAVLPALAMLAGHEVIWLAADEAPAAWAAALITRWAEAMPPEDLVRRAQVAVGLAMMSPARLPSRGWGVGGQMVPALRAGAVGRWCDCAWRPCEWCEAGGIADAPCPSCLHCATTA